MIKEHASVFTVYKVLFVGLLVANLILPANAKRLYSPFNLRFFTVWEGEVKWMGSTSTQKVLVKNFNAGAPALSALYSLNIYVFDENKGHCTFENAINEVDINGNVRYEVTGLSSHKNGKCHGDVNSLSMTVISPSEIEFSFYGEEGLLGRAHLKPENPEDKLVLLTQRQVSQNKRIKVNLNDHAGSWSTTVNKERIELVVKNLPAGQRYSKVPSPDKLLKRSVEGQAALHIPEVNCTLSLHMQDVSGPNTKLEEVHAMYFSAGYDEVDLINGIHFGIDALKKGHESCLESAFFNKYFEVIEISGVGEFLKVRYSRRFTLTRVTASGAELIFPQENLINTISFVRNKISESAKSAIDFNLWDGVLGEVFARSDLTMNQILATHVTPDVQRDRKIKKVYRRGCLSKTFCGFKGGEYLNAVYEGEVEKILWIERGYDEFNYDKPKLFRSLMDDYIYFYKTYFSDCITSGADRRTYKKTISEVNEWGFTESSADYVFEYFVNPSLSKECDEVCAYRGAKDIFIEGLSQSSEKTLTLGIKKLMSQNTCDSPEVMQFEKNLKKIFWELNKI